MLAIGFASVRIAANKTKVHQSTWVARGRKNVVLTRTVDGRMFISIASILKTMGDAVDALNLNDWSDVVFDED